MKTIAIILLRRALTRLAWRAITKYVQYRKVSHEYQESERLRAH